MLILVLSPYQAVDIHIESKLICGFLVAGSPAVTTSHFENWVVEFLCEVILVIDDLIIDYLETLFVDGLIKLSVGC